MRISDDTSIVGGIIGNGFVETVLEQADATETIIIDMFPEYYDFADRFVGYNFVYPGLYRSGTFLIQNNTGNIYTVTDYMFRVDSIGFQRTYNGMAQGMGLSLAEVATLPPDEWYYLNVAYYGEENLNDLETLRRLFGHEMTGPGSAGGYGVSVGLENSLEMIELAKQYLYRQCQFSFDIAAFPVNGQNLSGESITLWDYINKTAENRDIVLNQVFSQPIEATGFSSAIGYTNDDRIGNVCNGAYVDFMFTLTLNIVNTVVLSINYDGNNNTGGAVPADEDSYAIGESATVLGNTGNLTRVGYVFSGWNTAPDGSGTTFVAGDTIVMNSDVTLYALWRAEPIPPPVKPCCPCNCICGCSCRPSGYCQRPYTCEPYCHNPCSPGIHNAWSPQRWRCTIPLHYRFSRRQRARV